MIPNSVHGAINWMRFANSGRLQGASAELARRLIPLRMEGGVQFFTIHPDHAYLATQIQMRRVAAALGKSRGVGVARIVIEVLS